MPVPLDLAIALGLLSFGLGCLTGFCLRPRVHRVPDAVLKPYRADAPVYVGKWTPNHAKGAR